VRTKQMAWGLFVFFLFTIPGYSQSLRAPHTQSIDGTAAPREDDQSRERLASDMAKKANQDRHAAVKADTDKLLKLAGELKQYVDRTNENMLSVEVLKKAEEIEKLAHSVKDKMKGPN
jgi:hypothetical protein